jgi:hypothetical protein
MVPRSYHITAFFVVDATWGWAQKIMMPMVMVLTFGVYF